MGLEVSDAVPPGPYIPPPAWPSAETAGFSLLGGLRYTVLMYRALAIAVLLAAAAFLPSLEAQMLTMQHPGGTARISVGPGFRAGQPPLPGRLGVMSPRHNLRFNIRFGNSCLTSPFFDPLLPAVLLLQSVPLCTTGLAVPVFLF
jgi:hypothetical protein